MAKKISKADISEDDLFGAIKKSAEDTIVIIDKLSAALTATAEAVKTSIGGAKFDSTKAIDNFVKSTEKANKLQMQSIKLNQQRSKAVGDRNKAMGQQQKRMQEVQKTAQATIRTDEAAARQKNRLNKEGERAARVAKNEASEYKKLEKKTRDLKNQSKELAATMLRLASEGKKNTKEYRNLATQYKRVTTSAKVGDSALKKIDSTVGDNFRNVGNYTGALKGLGRMFTQLAGGFGLMQLVKGAGGIIVDFDQAVADLGAISADATKEELTALTEQAKELGATTQFSATQITQMQIELSKLGFSADQISKSTKDVANFAAATGADIPAAAKLAGSAMRGFGMEASEMGRITSVLGVATTKSALSFESLDSALSTVAPVANAFGFSIEDTTALLGQLANAGFDASSAGTATKNLMLNMADSSGQLAKELGRPIESLDDMAIGLKELQDKGIDLSEALQLTDKRSVAAFETFLKGTDSMIDLRDSITDVDAELQIMADKKLDTIGGQFTLLSSAWEGFVLSVNEGSGIGETVKNVLGFIAKNLTTIMGVIGRVVVAWGLYKGALIATKVVQFAMGGGFKDLAKSMVAQVAGLKNVVKGQKAVTDGSKTMAKGVKSAGKAMNAVPWMLIIGLAVELGMALWNAASGAAALERANKALDAGRARGEKIAAITNAALQKRIKLAQQAIDLKLAKGEIDEVKALELKVAMYKKEAKWIQSTIDANWKKKKSLEAVRVQTQKDSDAYDAWLGTWEGAAWAYVNPVEVGLKTAGFEQTINEIASQTESLTKQNNELAGAGEGLNDILKDLNIETIELTGSGKKGLNLGGSKLKQEKKINTEFKTQIDLLTELNTLLADRRQLEQDLLQIGINEDARRLEDDIAAEVEVQRVSAETTGEIDVDKAEELVAKKSEILRSGIEEDMKFEIEELGKGAIETNRQRRADLEQQNKDLQDGAKGHKEELKTIEANYQIELAKIKKLEGEEMTNLQREVAIIKADGAEDLLDIDREAADEVAGINDELIQGQITYAEGQKDLMKGLLKDGVDAAKELADAEKQMWQDRMDIANVATDFLTKLSDRRIAKLDKEISAAEEQANFLRSLAANGNIEAKDSLAEQQRLIDEANRKKIQEEKLKAKIEFANTVFQTYGSKVQAGSQNPMADTIKDVSLLTQFIAQFTPQYLEGTEDTGTHGQGVDGKGGFEAILHPNERVLTKEQNKRVGGMNNNSLAQLAEEYQNGSLVSSGAVQIGNGWDSHLVVKRLESIEKAIENKPEHSLDVENVVLGAMDIVRTTRRGGDVNYNRYRLKK